MAETRFSLLDWANPLVGTNIKLLGLGGLGSWLTLYLHRIGIHNIVGIDKDIIEEVNVSNALFMTNSVSGTKATQVQILARNLSNRSRYGNLTCYNGDVNNYTYTNNYKSNIVISCLDSIAVRKQQFEVFLDYVNWQSGELYAFIDMRMAAEVGTIFIVDSEEDVQRYRDTLFDQSEAYEAPCGNKATSHCASALSCFATSMVNNILCNHFEGFKVRRVPFKYHIDMINFINEAYD